MADHGLDVSDIVNAISIRQLLVTNAFLDGISVISEFLTDSQVSRYLIGSLFPHGYPIFYTQNQLSVQIPRDKMAENIQIKIALSVDKVCILIKILAESH